MKLAFAEPKYFSDSISIISELVNEATFSIEKDKIELIALDPANVALISFTLLSSVFSEYELEKPVKLSVSLESLKQVLRRIKGSDNVSLSFDEKKNKLQIKIVGESIRNFNLALINLDEKEQKIPSLSFPVKINTSTSIFDDAIEDMGVIADALTFTAEPEKFVISTESHFHSAHVEMPADDNTSIELKGSAVMSKYSLEYLKKMVKASKIASNVRIEFSKDYPLRLNYLVKDKMNLSFILAPRVSD